MIKHQQQLTHDDYFFKCCDRFSTEQAVKMRYESKQRNIRLNNKLKELNLNTWDISTSSSLHHLTAFYNGVEIFNEKKTAR